MEAKDTVMSDREKDALLRGMPYHPSNEAGWMNFVRRYGLAQAEMSFPAGRQAEAKELEGIVQFAYKVAVAMDALRSSHVFFILQQAFGDETEWSDSQEILTNIITRAQGKFKEWES